MYEWRWQEKDLPSHPPPPHPPPSSTIKTDSTGNAVFHITLNLNSSSPIALHTPLPLMPPTLALLLAQAGLASLLLFYAAHRHLAAASSAWPGTAPHASPPMPPHALPSHASPSHAPPSHIPLHAPCGPPSNALLHLLLLHPPPGLCRILAQLADPGLGQTRYRQGCGGAWGRHDTGRAAVGPGACCMVRATLNLHASPWHRSYCTSCTCRYAVPPWNCVRAVPPCMPCHAMP